MSAPEHYVLEATPVPFEIERSQEENERIIVENSLMPGSVELVKIDVDTELPLQGAFFRLEDTEGNILEEELETDEEGRIVVEDLRPGTYQFVETQAPQHYQLATEPIVFTIEPSQTERLFVNAENQLILGDVQLLKIDDVDGTVLEDAEFELQTVDGEVVRAGLVTNEDGVIVARDLYPGEYQFVEVSAPADYELDATPVPFAIDFSQEETVVVTKENHLIPGSVELVKVDDVTGEAIEGAIFRLEDAEGNVLEEELETDEEGRIVVEDLRPGSYQFVETEAPQHYQLATEPIVFTIEPSQTERLFVNAENQLILGDVQLLKIDDVDGTVLEDAEFELQTVDGEVIRTGLVTNEDGAIVARDLYPGEYQFVEVSAPANYELDATPVPFAIDFSQEQTVVVTKENRLVPGSVELVKVDDITGEAIEGAIFRLEDAEGNVLEEELETDEEGRIVVEDLRPGFYQFVEIEAPDDYELDSEPHEFEIVRSQEERPTLTAENRLIPGSVELLKVDDVTGEPLSGAVFNLETIDGELVAEGLVSSEEGHVVVTDLRPGEYRFVEVEAPADYLLNPASLPFEIERSQTERLEVEFENSLIPGTVELTKVDDVTGEPLAGALFNIVDENGDVVQQNLMTGESGRIVVDHLRPGNYQFVEVSAPEHYVLDATPIPFVIERSQEERESIIVENSLMPGSVELVKIDVNTEQPLEGAIFRLEDAEGNVLEEELETDEEGRIVVEDLRPGSYQFVETQAPQHYQLAEEPIVFTIELSQTERLFVNAENQLILGDVQLLKIDDVDGTVLEDAEFELQTVDGEVVRAGLVTNEDGAIVARDLYPGEYQFVEVSAPADYELDATPVPFTIDFSQEETVLVTKENQLILGSVELVHVDHKTGEPLAGAEFNLVNEDGEIIREGLVTDENGRIFVDGLRPGHYQFIEVRAPEHYQSDATPINVEIIRSQETTVQVTKESRLILGSVELVKVDADKQQPLAGAIFQLTNEEGDVIEENLETGQDGLIVVEDLCPGDYQFVEVTAPENYQLLSEAIDFTIVYSQEERLQLVVENELLPVEPEKEEEPQAGSGSNDKRETKKKHKTEEKQETQDEQQILPATANPFIWTMMLIGVIALLLGMIILIGRRVYLNTRS
ncbi:SpaA isopeptide-forming pilin-related protein [Bacillus sp. JCM 19034]|uniref:SpaA isopeptide-forming pilin-related protein n=1 Tax=Bacillus sp. JCM 19034 TaxID=1481928 RepID=UPI000780F369|nr:SpaA isopeptide-forming pilin-related protein [Bacillus sp. JCM 19034]